MDLCVWVRMFCSLFAKKLFIMSSKLIAFDEFANGQNGNSDRTKIYTFKRIHKKKLTPYDFWHRPINNSVSKFYCRLRRFYCRFVPLKRLPRLLTHTHTHHFFFCFVRYCDPTWWTWFFFYQFRYRAFCHRYCCWCFFGRGRSGWGWLCVFRSRTCTSYVRQ